MRQQVKAIIRFGLAMDVLVVGGAFLARVFFNEAPVEFHEFVEASLWATIAAGAICAALMFQMFRMAEEVKRSRVKGRASRGAVSSRSAAAKSQKTDSAVLLGGLIMVPGALIIIPICCGSVVFAHDYLWLLREFGVFVTLWFCCKAYNLTKKLLPKAVA